MYYNHYKIKTTTKENNLYEGDINFSGIQYYNYINKILLIQKIIGTQRNTPDHKGILTNILKILYEYLLLSPNEINVDNKNNNIKTNKQTITKFIPLSIYYFQTNELLKRFNIFNSKTNYINTIQKHNTLYIGNDLSLIEVIKYNNYKTQNIKTIISSNSNYFEKKRDGWMMYIKNLQSIYHIDITNYNKSIYDLLETTFSSITKYQLVYTTILLVDYDVDLFENHYNTPNIFVNMLIGLKYTDIGGTFIIHFGSLAYKHIADIYVIISSFFEMNDIWNSKLQLPYKKNGTFGIFQKFKGISETEYNKLLDILDEIKNLYPNGSINFNIYDPTIRHKYFVSKPINADMTSTFKHIIGFLDLNDNDNVYSKIKLFNEEKYFKYNMFLDKLYYYLTLEDKTVLNKFLNQKTPTNEQLTNAILYCNKWGIEYWDKYSNKPFQDKFGRSVLTETFGLHQPILFHFKTSPQIRISQPITLKLFKHSSIIQKQKSKTLKSRVKSQLKNKSFINNIIDIDELMKNYARNKKMSKTKKTKINYNVMIQLTPDLHYSNTRIDQAGYLIDSRRDFTKHIDLQNTKWWAVNKQFRYYKHKDDLEKVHLDEVVRTKLKDNSISQAWLKMYEIITDCEIVSKVKHGVFHSFHICEAPGTFINALNNYIHTKTKYEGFDWMAQSLHPNVAKIKDQFGLIKRHSDRWNWGTDGTGDITKIENINYYKKLIDEKETPIELITSDCGLSMKECGYEKVAFASLLSILYILPIGGTMIYKILTPIEEPIILNLVYIAYCNFKELLFYKPVQNNQSREFYIIGKGYLGTDINILSTFFKVLKNFKDGSNIDLMNDKYPEAFVRQFISISNTLADNYVYTIERNVYYLDNYENLTPEFFKLMVDYYDEKNHDWIEKYKPIKLENVKYKL